MSTHPDLTKKQRRDAAREARLASERVAARAATRKRRLTQLGGVLAAAAVVVAIAVAVSSGGGSAAAVAKKPGETVAGQMQSRAMLQGIPQSGLTLGDPNAKVTLVEFADPQCPFCREYSLNVMPRLVQDYVRTGKVKMVFRPLTFIGQDSVRAASVAVAAAAQNRLWNYMDLMYFNQGTENSGYATDAFLRGLGTAVPGLDVTRAFAARQSSAVSGQLATANALAQRYGVNSTPSFLIGRGNSLRNLNLQSASLGALQKAIDAELKA